MVSNLRFSVLLFFLLASFAASSTFISDNVFESHGSTGRTLLQAKKSCPQNFEFLNYTIVTSKCKGPRYDPNSCCSAFKELACPYAEALNDLSNDCATTMFSYLNLYGRYPPGLFASECRGDKNGLLCPEVSPTSSPSSGSRTRGCIHCLAYFPMLMLTVLFIFLF